MLCPTRTRLVTAHQNAAHQHTTAQCHRLVTAHRNAAHQHITVQCHMRPWTKSIFWEQQLRHAKVKSWTLLDTCWDSDFSAARSYSVEGRTKQISYVSRQRWGQTSTKFPLLLHHAQFLQTVLQTFHRHLPYCTFPRLTAHNTVSLNRIPCRPVETYRLWRSGDRSPW